jgi:hypothetical protein
LKGKGAHGAELDLVGTRGQIVDDVAPIRLGDDAIGRVDRVAGVIGEHDRLSTYCEA